MNRLCLVALITLSLTTPSSAENKSTKLTLADKRIVKKTRAQLKATLKKVNKVCRSHLTATVDWSSFKRANAINLTLKHTCVSQLGRLERVCKDKDGQEAIRSSLNSMRCVYATKDDRSHQLEGKTLIESFWVKADKGGESYTQNSPLLDVWLAENL